MRFDAGSRARVSALTTLDFDPTGSTVELKVDAVWYAATWLGTAVLIPATTNNPARWTQTARTTGYFAGPEVAVPGAAVVLAAVPPRHLTQTRITLGTDIIVADSSPVDIA